MIIALVTVSVLKGQLNQAEHQSAASDYAKRETFDLSIRYDRFLYETVQRRRIQNNQSGQPGGEPPMHAGMQAQPGGLGRPGRRRPPRG